MSYLCFIDHVEDSHKQHDVEGYCQQQWSTTHQCCPGHAEGTEGHSRVPMSLDSVFISFGFARLLVCSWSATKDARYLVNIFERSIMAGIVRLTYTVVWPLVLLHLVGSKQRVFGVPSMCFRLDRCVCEGLITVHACCRHIKRCSLCHAISRATLRRGKMSDGRAQGSLATERWGP
jgi:hypothetical protein